MLLRVGIDIEAEDEVEIEVEVEEDAWFDASFGGRITLSEVEGKAEVSGAGNVAVSVMIVTLTS